MLTQVIQVDLSKPLRPISVDSRYGELMLVVCWGYSPLGMVQLYPPPSTHGFGEAQLRSEIVQSVGWALWEHTVARDLIEPKEEADLPPISVVVCTRDRLLSLERCLSALARLDYPTYEVVVVDNCSRDVRVRESVVDRGLRYVREDTPGLDWARNRGIREARYELIAFIDDDALAAPGWLRGVARGFQDPEVMVLTGIVLPAELETQAQIDFEAYGGMSKGFTAFTIRRDGSSERDTLWASRWGVGANMAFRRALFEAIGDFDVALDVGTPTGGGGDIEFFHRAVQAGYALRYEPAAMAFHVHRREHVALRRQVYHNGRSFVAYLLAIARDRRCKRATVAWFALRHWLWQWLLRRLIRGLFRRDRWTIRWAATELWGSLSGPWAYWRSRRAATRVARS
jgi:glycosyltransferase involved in cell wall biosynthesis